MALIKFGVLAAVLGLLAPADAFTAARPGISALSTRPLPLASRGIAPVSSPQMNLHDTITSIILAADVSEDFDLNSLPGAVQEVLVSPVVLAIPIGIGMVVAGAIIAFLIWSMGGI